MSDLLDEVPVPYDILTHRGEKFSFRRMDMEDWAALKVQISKDRTDKLYAAINREIDPDDWQRRLAAKAAVDTEIRSVLTIHYLMDYCRIDPEGILQVLAYALVSDVTDPAGRRKLLARIHPVQQVEAANHIVMRPEGTPVNPSKPAAAPAGNGARAGGRGKRKPNPTGPTSLAESKASGPASTPAD